MEFTGVSLFFVDAVNSISRLFYCLSSLLYRKKRKKKNPPNRRPSSIPRQASSLDSNLSQRIRNRVCFDELIIMIDFRGTFDVIFAREHFHKGLHNFRIDVYFALTKSAPQFHFPRKRDEIPSQKFTDISKRKKKKKKSPVL